MSVFSWSILLMTCLFLSFLIWRFLPVIFEEPEYQVLRKAENFEVRIYPKILVASLDRKGKRDWALRNAFPYLAEYIGGKNREGGKISMTVPVIQTKDNEKEAWKVSFIMPNKFSAKSIPKPKNSEIRLNEMTPFKVGVVRFSGRWNDQVFQLQERLLRNWLKAEGFSKPMRIIYAFYNGPMTPGIFRRNEILLILE